MPVQLFADPLRNVVQGIMEAHGLKQQIAQAALQQQRAKMMEEDQKRSTEDAARRRQMEDIQSLQMLEGAARPVQAGTVAEKATLNTGLEGLPAGLAAQPAEAQLLRKPDPARLVRYKTADGQQREFELLSRPDQEARAIEQLKTKAGVESRIDADRFKARAQITDTFKEKDRELARELQDGRITYQQYAAEVAQRAKAGETAATQKFQKELQGMRDASAMDRTNVEASSRLTAAAQKVKGGGGGDQGLIDAVSANPTLFDSLTPTVKTRILPALATAGVQIPGKRLSGEASKVVGIAQTILPEIEQIKAIFKNGSFRSRAVDALTGRDANLARLIDRVSDKLGRIRSGGAINKDEAASFKAQMVRKMDIYNNDSKPALEALDSIRDEAMAVLSAMKQDGGAPAAADPLGIR